MAIAFVNHDVGAAAEIADHIAMMYTWRFVETATARGILRGPQHPSTQGPLAATVHGGPRGPRLATIPGAPLDLAQLPLGCAVAPGCRQACDPCTQHDVPEGILPSSAMIRCLRAFPTPARKVSA
jgi:peptide/nickel transport system ATP-binding protein